MKVVEPITVDLACPARGSRIRRALQVSLLLLAAGCGGDREAGPPGAFAIDTLPTGEARVSSPASGLWDADASAAWELVDELRIGAIEGEGPYVFGNVSSVIEGPLGRVWVADTQANEIRIFDHDGVFVRSVGRQGEGPGEFGRLATVHLAPDGTIRADDAGLRRWVVCDSGGAHVAVHPGNSSISGGIRRWSAGGVPRITRNLPLVRNPTIALGFHGDLWVTDDGPRYLVRRLSLGGDTLMTLEREFEPVPVPPDARQEAPQELEPPEEMRSGENDPDRVPTHYPAFDTVHPATDGSLWVRRHGEDGSEVLDVFASDGICLGQIDFPGDLSRFRISHATDERVYEVKTDDLGVGMAAVFRIVRP